MMQRVLACAALAVTLPVLSGCGKNPTDALDFKAPAGWTSTPSMFGVKLWMKGDKSKGEVVFLMDLPGKADAKLNQDIVKQIGSSGGGDIGTVEKISHIKICGDHDAEYVKATSNKNGRHAETEIVLTNWDKDMYMALYSHSVDAAADPAGQAAIRSLCLKK
jgi:hypothetical protein